MNKKAIVLVSFGLALAALAGCKNKCITLEEKVCADLGPADCKVWQENGGADAMIPKNRVGGGASKMCDVLLDSYPTVLSGQKQVTEGYKAAAKLNGSGATPAAK